jgi:hypothetical protein
MNHEKTMRPIRMMSLPLFVALLAGACAPSGGGTYFAVDLLQTSLGESCAIGPNLADDRSTFLQNDTFVFYSGPEDTHYLDVGSTTLAGAKTDSGFTFRGESLDIEFPTGEIKQSVTLVQTISWEPDGTGAWVTGTITVSRGESYSCDAAVGQCPSSSECTSTTPFNARRIDGVGFEHDPLTD